MGTFGIWIKAFRLRTLPLAMSSIIVGAFVSASIGKFSWQISLLAAFTTLLLQILSNLANDYGDYKTGADNDARVGPKRTVQLGEISATNMKTAIVIFVVLSLISGGLLIYLGTQGISLLSGLIFFLLGLASIFASINYTIGKHPYGYMGFGDLFVLIFFGIIGVAGTFYLNTHSFNADILLPAFSIGFLSVAVLNLNNMRDIDNDTSSGKQTIVVKMGMAYAKYYHYFLVIIPFILCFIFVFLHYKSIWQFLFMLTFPLFLMDLITISRNKEPGLLDPFLKKQALKTLLFSFTFGIGLIL